MKRIVTLTIVLACCWSAFAQQTNLSQMTEKARNEYLTKLAKEVTENIGPGWLQGEVSITISPLKVFDGDGDTREHIKALLGRKYYEVRIIYDEKTRKEVGWSHASEVRIWEDSGEPIDVIYGHNYGRHFLDKPYREFVKEGIGPTDQVKFEKMYIPEWMKFCLMTEEERKEYLIKKAKEVALAFAPEWMQWEVTPQVSPKQKYFSNNPRQDIQKNVGREYYAVTFYYNGETKTKIKYDYAALVRIWADDGEVASIGAGDWVKAFLDTSYEQMKKEGIKPEDQLHFEPIIDY